MKALSNKKIIVFGSMFDPIHQGHEGIINFCLQQLNFDYVILLPALIKYDYKPGKHVSIKHRINMLRLLYGKNPRILISTHEANNKNANKTFETLKYYANKYPSCELSFALGSDCGLEFHTWKQAEAIVNNFQIYCFIRDTDHLKSKFNSNFNVIKDYDIINVASSDIKQGQKWNLISAPVLKYIHDFQLYYHDILKYILSPERYDHSLSVSKEAAKLCRLYTDISPIKAKIAGLMHDVAKELPYDVAKKQMLDNYPENLSQHPAIWHQYLSKNFLSKKLLYQENDVLNAISSHTSPAFPMSKLTKILFCADKISADRTYKGVGELRKKIYQDFDLGFQAILHTHFQFLKMKNISFSASEKEIIKKYLTINQNNSLL